MSQHAGKRAAEHNGFVTLNILISRSLFFVKKADGSAVGGRQKIITSLSTNPRCYRVSEKNPLKKALLISPISILWFLVSALPSTLARSCETLNPLETATRFESQLVSFAYKEEGNPVYQPSLVIMSLI